MDPTPNSNFSLEEPFPSRDRAQSLHLERPKITFARKKLSFDDVESESNDVTNDTEATQSTSFLDSMKKNLSESSGFNIFQKDFWSSPRSEKDLFCFSPDLRSNSQRSSNGPLAFEISPRDEVLHTINFCDNMICEIEESKEIEEIECDQNFIRRRGISMSIQRPLIKESDSSTCFSTPRDYDFGRLQPDSANNVSLNNQSFVELNQNFLGSENSSRLFPTCKNLKNPDLAGITPETLETFMSQGETPRYLIVDCRYGYEFQGGHIKGAINVTSPELLEEIFFTKRHLLECEDFLKALKDDFDTAVTSEFFKKAEWCPPQSHMPIEDPLILIFHCEFSQKRGPRALRALRNRDRQLNAESWPNLYYPEVYILEGGYQDFVKQCPNACTPCGSYVQMICKDHRIEYSVAREKELRDWKKKSAGDRVLEEKMKQWASVSPQ